MSGKLDKPLDEIVSAQRRSAGRRRPQRRSVGDSASGPVGGIRKPSRAIRGAVAKPAPAKAAFATGESKIIVSNLVSVACIRIATNAAVADVPPLQPKDVSEQQIKVCFRRGAMSSGLCSTPPSSPQRLYLATPRLPVGLVDSAPA